MTQADAHDYGMVVALLSKVHSAGRAERANKMKAQFVHGFWFRKLLAGRKWFKVSACLH